MRGCEIRESSYIMTTRPQLSIYCQISTDREARNQSTSRLKELVKPSRDSDIGAMPVMVEALWG